MAVFAHRVHKKRSFRFFGGDRERTFLFFMDPYISVRGSNRLHGEIPIGGMKNAALPILFATLLVRGTVQIENVPPVTDVETTLLILKAVGAVVTRLSPTALRINTDAADPNAVPLELTTRLRASSYLLGAGLGRFGRIRTGFPGGCDFGSRPINWHFRLFSAMGAESCFAAYTVEAVAPKGLHGARVRLDFPSVGATVNGILAAATANGRTVIENAAREPHVVDLAVFLNQCGASVSGAGTPRITVDGVTALHGCCHRVVPDMIEAGTYLAAMAGVGGRIRLSSVEPRHLDAVLDRLNAMGVTTECGADSITAVQTSPLIGTDIETHPYPGFPTDMQPQFAPLLCLSASGGCIFENVWDDRFRYVEELRRMGANVNVRNRCARFRGDDRLIGTEVAATDLRAGAAMLVAGLCAEGTTVITRPHHIDRGYPDFVNRLRDLGADISRTE